MYIKIPAAAFESHSYLELEKLPGIVYKSTYPLAKPGSPIDIEIDNKILIDGLMDVFEKSMLPLIINALHMELNEYSDYSDDDDYVTSYASNMKEFSINLQ
eukprot:Pgem_evm1s19513